MRRRIAGRRSRALFAGVLLLAFLVSSCRTARPDGAPLTPLSATTSEQAIEQLRARRAAFRGVKSLMKVRATTKGRTQSFRANLTIDDARRMSLIAYTPVGTTALTLTADGERVSVKNQMEGSDWEGSAEDLGRSFGFLGSSLLPAEMAMLITGLPPRDDVAYETAPEGLRSASIGDLRATFDPPAYPAQRVVVTRGDDRIEIEHLEIVEANGER